MRIRAAGALAIALVSVACGGTSLFRQYEYEEDVYLSLDRSATIYVNSSIAALNALHGTTFDASPLARVNRDGVRALYTSPVSHVVWVRDSRRSGRRFVHLRIETTDITRLAAAPPFAWSTYEFRQDGNEYVYRQVVGAPTMTGVPYAGWNGREIVAFRLHLPSKINYQNTGTETRRGNILIWEQLLRDRLHGVPLTLDARIQTQSILYRTLWLFAATFLAVAVGFVAVIWWVVRRGARHAETV